MLQQLGLDSASASVGVVLFIVLGLWWDWRYTKRRVLLLMGASLVAGIVLFGVDPLDDWHVNVGHLGIAALSALVAGGLGWAGMPKSPEALRRQAEADREMPLSWIRLTRPAAWYERLWWWIEDRVRGSR